MTTQSSTSTTPREAGGPVLDPKRLHAMFTDACNAGDVDRMLGFFEADAIVVEQTGDLTSGIRAIRAHVERLLSMKPVMRNLGSRTVISGDLALLSSHWKCDATAPDGSAIHLDFRGSELARRQPDGTWRLVIDNPWGAPDHSAAATS